MSLQLAQAKRISVSTPLPFTLSLGKDNINTFECRKILRILPQKRLVCQGIWQGQTVIAKVFFLHRHFVNEKSSLEKLNQLGLPCPSILYHQADKAHDVYLLITAYLPHNSDLKQAWFDTQSEQQKIKLLNRAIRTISTMHTAGCYQRDIHWGNFLLNNNTDTISIIDAGQILFEVLSQAKKQQNLALFIAQMEPKYDHLIPHLDLFLDNTFSPDAFYQQVKQQRKKRITTYIKKCLRSTSDFLAEKNCRHLWVSNRNLYDPRPLLTPTQLNQIIRSSTEPLKLGNSATVVKVLLNNHAIVIKRYNIKDIAHFFKKFWRPSRARRSWQYANTLMLLGIATPKPIAFLEDRLGPILLTSYFITDYHSGQTLPEYIQELSANRKSIPGWLDQQLTQMLHGLWRTGLCHGDFKASNFLISNEKLFLIDLDSMKQLSGTGAIQSAITRDTKRFLANWEGNTHKHFEQLLKQITDNIKIINKQVA